MLDSRKFWLIEPSGADGGMFPYLNGLGRALSEFELSVTIITSSSHKAHVTWSDRVNTLYFFGNFKATKNKIYKLFYLWCGVFKILFNSIRSRPDFINYHIFEFNLLNLLNLCMFRLCCANCLLTVHDISSLKNRRETRFIFLKVFFGVANMITVHNRHMMDQMELLGCERNKLIISLHGIDMPAVSRAGIDEKQKQLFRFGAIGALKRSKGLETLIEAFAIARDDLGNSELHIIGRDYDGYCEQLLRLVNELGISSHCHIREGFLRENKFITELAKLDVVILPYQKIYQSGMAMTSAILGKPIIVSDLEGFRESLGDDALYFETSSPDDLAKSMIKMHGDKRLRSDLSSKVKQRMISQFSWQAVAKNLLESIDEKCP